MRKPNLKQSKTANQLSCSSSTLQRYRNDIKMLSPYRNQPNNTNKRTNKASNTNFDNSSHRDPDVKRPRLTPNDLKPTPQNVNENGKKVKAKNNLKGGSMHENIEINDEYLGEILYINDLKKELAMQNISSDKTFRSDTVQDLKDFNSQSLTTQVKKKENS